MLRPKLTRSRLNQSGGARPELALPDVVEPVATPAPQPEPIRLDAVYTVAEVNTRLVDGRGALYRIVLTPDEQGISPITIETSDAEVYQPFRLGATFSIDLTPADAH